MSVLSILKNVKIELKLLIPIAILIAFVVDNARCGGHQQDLDAGDDNFEYKNLPHCDENLLQDRGASQR